MVTEGGAIPIPPDVKTRLEITDGDNVEVCIEKLNLDRVSMHRFYTPGRTTPITSKHVKTPHL